MLENRVDIACPRHLVWIRYVDKGTPIALRISTAMKNSLIMFLLLLLAPAFAEEEDVL